MIYAERVFSFFILCIVSTFLFTSFQYEMLSTNGVGGAFLPRIISLILLILAGIYVFSNFRNNSKKRNTKTFPTKEILLKQMFMIILIVICLLLIKKIGMLITLGLFLLGTLHYIEKITWAKSIIFSTVTVTCLYFLFVKWLNIVLPSGILF